MHLQQLRKARTLYAEGTLAADGTADCMTKTGIQVVHEALDKAEHFLFTAIPHLDDEILASADAMKEAGVWRLPYPITTFEFKATIHSQTFDVTKPDTTFIFVAMEQARAGTTHTELGEFIPLPSFIRWIFARDLTDKRIWMNCTSIFHHEVQNILTTFLVTLSTRGIKRERWSGDHKIIVGRREPANAYTRVLIREAVNAGHGTSEPGERYYVRLHMRRGHKRDQRYGKGLQLSRPIWIEPTLVGYEKEGRIRHHEYEM